MSRHDRPSQNFDGRILLLLLCILAAPLRAQEAPFQVIVNANNPANEVSMSALSRIFLGKVTVWADGESVVPYDLPLDSTVRSDFSRIIHRHSIATIQKYWQRAIFTGSATPPEERSSAEAIAAVRSTPGGIAYVDSDWSLPPGVKRLVIIDLPADVGQQTGDESGGVSSSSSPSGALLALAVSPASADEIWASFQDRGLWVSTDGGETWGPAPSVPETVQVGGSSDPSMKALAFDRIDPQLILAGGRNGLYRSLDLGQQWQRVATDDPAQHISGVREIVTTSHSPGTFFVRTSDALWRSDDSGGTFARLPTPGGVRAFTVDPSTGDLWLATRGLIQFSQDRGESWNVSLEIPGGSSPRQILVTHLAGAKTLWVASERVLLRVELDEEGRPVEGEGGTLQSSLRREVRRLFALDDTIYAVAERGIHELAVDGQTWKYVSGTQDAVLAADPYGSGRAYLGNSEGRVWRRDHSGEEWRQIFDLRDLRSVPAHLEVLAKKKKKPAKPQAFPLRQRCALEEGHVGALAVHPTARGVVWAGSEHGVFRSDDGGRSWGPPGHGLVVTDVHSLAIDPKTPTTLWAGTHGGGLYVSRDSGASWTAADGGSLSLRTVREVAVDPDVPDLLHVATPVDVFVSRDRGRYWRPITGLNDRGQRLSVNDAAWQIVPRALAADPDQHPPMALVDESGQLFDVNAASADRQTRSQPSGSPKARLGGRVCAESGRSIDRRGSIEISSTMAPRDLTFAEDSEGATVPWVATALGLWRGPLGEEDAWTRLPLATNVAAVEVDSKDPRRIYAAAVDGLWRSGDGGLTWGRWGVDEPVFSLALDPGPSEWVYAGLSGGRVAVVRESSGEQPKATDVELVARVRGAVDRRQLRGVTSVLQMYSSAPPDDSGAAFRQAASSTPHTMSRLRALYTAESLSRGASGDVRESLRGQLMGSLQRIYNDGLAHGRGRPTAVGTSPAGRWLLSDWRFDDGLRSHSEIRLYAAEEPGWERVSEGQNDLGSGTAWQELHDLALEPRHLRPAWILQDPGPRLAWSDSRSLLATHGGPDRLLIWSLPAQLPEVDEVGRVTAPRTVFLERGQVPRGARSVLSDRGRWMAVAQHAANPITRTRTAILRLWRLGDTAERVTLDILRRSESEPSPYFTRLLFTGDERYIVGFRADGSGQVWRVRFDGEVETEALPGEGFKAVTRGPDGRWMATVMGDQHRSELEIWPLQDPGLFQPISLAAGSGVSQVSFHDDGTWLSAVTDGTARLWDLLQRTDRQTQRSPEEPPEVTLAANAPGVCASVFDPQGDWWTHDQSASRLWKLRGPGANGQLTRTRRPNSTRLGDGNLCRQLPSAAHRIGALAIERGRRPEMLKLWNLAGPELGQLSAQMRRFGPSDLHFDEGPLREPDFLLDLWPERPLKDLSDGALSSLACKLVGRPLSRQEWSFAMGDAAYRPLCPSLPES